MHRYRVAECMHASPIVVVATTSIEEAEALMDQHHIRRLPVVQDGRLVGIITQSDLRATRPTYATTLSAHEWRALLSHTHVAECMTHSPVVVAPDTLATDAAKLMLKHEIGGLPVVQNDQVVGMLTKTDLLRLLIAEEVIENSPR